MKRGFYAIMAAQFFSSLADNALLIVAIGLLAEMSGPAWMTPLLKFFFTVSYVVLAAFVGAFADSIPKGMVMFVTNLIKIFGCIAMLYNDVLDIDWLPPHAIVLSAYALVGLGAAAYSPAKYGILTELLPAEKLVLANGWVEGLTVGSIIIGTVLGGALISPRISDALLSFDIPRFESGIDTPAEAAIPIIVSVYALAAICNLFIPDTGVRYEQQTRNPVMMVRDFSVCFTTLWKDKLGQISLGVTTLFWGAGATLQFIVLAWAYQDLGLRLDKGAILQGITAMGIALGAVLAARYVPLKKSFSVLTVGVAMGITVISLVFVHYLPAVYVLLVAIGAMAGFFVVPMNALLQHRGHVLLSAGHSIAVQNFNENVSILIMLAIYAGMIRAGLPINTIIVLFGTFVSVSMLIVMRWHKANQRKGDSLHLIGMDKPR